MDSAPPSAYQRFLPWRRTFEVGFWVVLTLVNGIANSITVLIDIRRSELDFAAWQPAVWEFTSGLLMLTLVPALVWFTRLFPLHWDNWRRQLPWHLLASAVFSLVHVVGMVGLRMLIYRAQGMEYDFGPWPRELFYEYLKDIRSYASMVAGIEIYRFVLRRSQGEASLLDMPDEGEPVEPVDRPERFLVRKLGREFLVSAADIEWLQASGNYVNLRIREHDYPLRSTIAGIESKLDPRRFARVHRSYIVNLDLIASIEPLDTGDARLHLKDRTTLPCSRRYRAGLRGRAGATMQEPGQPAAAS
ncbi:LytTR family transcriptional regulator [Pseudoxanthomonas yeongjuensis]|uniref:LytTR family DNA-binding domain-containing protein n=1 Tax=Pseudoxanthomonas yeongjuensis TaxID=377616 RepID=UPI0013908533|nr:LytTR family DNA-binding domain-containing protein [Pseudoxanthomonas yeongjuensis]KAF1717853.1 LytTR family transcriptional regulator [Pseudoxanthomonas yeongjuensis]